jgi:ubiquinone biosynthesis protein
MFKIAAQDLARLRQITGILARHGLQHLASGLQTGELDETDPALRAETRLLETPRRVRMLLQDLGPTFIKLGQVLSTRADLIPTALQAELAHLQDNVASVPYDEITAQLEQSWRHPTGDILQHIDPEPLATASIAQVHRATLLNGREVVVKVQRPKLEQTIRADLDLLYLLARVIDATIAEAGLYRPIELVRAFESALLDELDFRIEARNARAVAANFADDPRVYIPAIVDAHSTREVLMMDYVEGTKITQLNGDHDRDVVLATLTDIAFEMGFVHGLFHADPHPGNLMVLSDNRVCLLDFGLVGRLAANMQQGLIQLTLAIANRDAESVVRLLYRVGRPDERVDLHAFRDHVSDLMARYLVRRLDEVDAAGLLQALLDTALRFRIRVPPDYALLLKAAVTVEGIVRTLNPELDIMPTIMPYAQRLMADRYSPEAVRQLALRSAVTLLDGANELPLLATQLLHDLEGGRLALRLNHPEMDRIGRHLNDLGTKLFLGMVAMGMIMGTFFIAASYPWEWHGMNVWGLFGAIISLGLLTLVLTWHILSTRLRKIRLAWLLKLFGRRGGNRR